MKILLDLSAENVLGRFAPSSLPHYEGTFLPFRQRTASLQAINLFGPRVFVRCLFENVCGGGDLGLAAGGDIRCSRFFFSVR